MNLTTFIICKIIGKLTVFFAVSGVQFAQSNSGLFHYHHTVFSQMKLKIKNILAKTETLQIILKMCSSPTRHPVHVRSVVPSVLAFSLSSHRHTYVSLLFNSRFIVSE